MRSPFRSSARTVISRARGTRPRMSGMLRQPSQSSTISLPTTVISGLMIASGSASLVLVLAVIERGDEHPDALVHLRRREADAVVLGHGVDHVVDQLLDDRAPDLGLLERPRFRAQHRMPHARDLQNRHIDELYWQRSAAARRRH